MSNASESRASRRAGSAAVALPDRDAAGLTAGPLLSGVPARKAMAGRQEQHAGWIRCDLDGRIREASRWVCLRLGYRLSELCGRPLEELVAPEARATLAEYWRSLLAGELSYCAWHHRCLTHAGETFWGQSSLAVVRDPNGMVFSVDVVLSDQLALNSTEVALAESRHRLAVVVSQAPIVLWAIDDQRVFTLSEGRGLESLGLKSGQAVGRVADEMYRDYPEVLAAIDRGLGGEEFTTQLTIDGQTFESVFCPMHDATGRVIGVTGVATDVSAWARAEEALRLNQERLRQQNAGLLALARSKYVAQGELENALSQINETSARVLEVSRTSVWLYTADRRAIRCADSFDAAQGGRHEAGSELLASDYPRYFAALETERSIRADNAEEDERTREFRETYFRPRGIGATLDAPIRSGGQVIGVVCNEHLGGPRAWTAEEELFAGSVADLVALALEARERRRAEEQLRQAMEELEARVQQRTAQLEAANEQLRREAAERLHALSELRLERRHLARIVVAHERDRQITAYEIHDGLVQDITAAQMYLESLLSAGPPALDASQRAALGTALDLVRKGIAEGRRLISGLRPTVIDEVGLVSAIDYLVSECRLANGQHVEFQEEGKFQDLDPLLEGTLYRIVQEALTNIQRHSQAKQAQVFLRQAQDRVLLEVRDDGIGFDPERVPRDRFGLEGIRERARLLGGQATVESRVGQGARILVDLPLTLAISLTHQETTA